MLPDRVPNPGPLSYESGALPIALRGPDRQENGRKTGLYRNFSLLSNLINIISFFQYNIIP